MCLSRLQRNYTEATKAEDFAVHNTFLKELLASDDVEIIQYHYDLLEDTKNVKLYQRVRAAFNKRSKIADSFLIGKVTTETNIQRRGDTIQILGHRRCIEALPIVRQMVGDSESWIRYNAIITLGWMGENEDIHTLGSLLTKEPDLTLRSYAATALRQTFFRDKELRWQILPYLVRAIHSETNEDVLRLFLISAQDIAAKRFGLKENIEQRTISGDVILAKAKFIREFPINT
jgi:hypothetical protein